MSCLPARQQIAAPLEDRVGGGRQVRVDPLQIEHDVETKLADVAGRARVLGHEHGRRCPRIAGQPLDLADFLSTGLRKADPAFDVFGGKRHQALLDDIAGMLEIGRECQDFR